MRDTLLFLGQAVSRRRATGAIAPSGRVLARAVADAVGVVPSDQVILELGPGTGVFTRELAERFPTARVVAVETNPAFAARLAETVPGVTVVTGCASRLEEHLAGLGLSGESVAAVVSGLPLLTLPPPLPERVLAAVARVLRPDRRFVQFTYSERLWRRFDPAGLRPDSPRRVWWNLPPAVVLSFTRDETPPPPPDLPNDS